MLGFAGKLLSGIMSMTMMLFSSYEGNNASFSDIYIGHDNEIIRIQTSLISAFENDFEQIFRSGSPIVINYQLNVAKDGEFIESSLMSGSDPVLFIGFSNVPEQVRNYISSSKLEVGTLVGNELIGTATFIRRQTGLSVFVKFGQGSRTPQNTIAQVEDLDRFPIPRYGLNLAIVAAALNTATNNLEITYQNRAQIGTHFRALSFIVQDGDTTHTIQDDGTVNFVDANDYKTILYQLKDLDL